MFLARCRYRWMHCLWFTAALLMLSCGHTARTTNEHSAPDRLLEPAVHDRYPNDVGRFLAGLPARSGSSLAALETADAWGQHRVELDRAWHKIDTEGLPAMREFQKRELAGQNPTAPLFYPFSGPDALMMTVFFPRAPVYVMIGLEPAGTLPSPAQLVQKDLETYLPEIRSTVASVLGRSFFITRQMDRQFRGQVTDGLLVPILQMLVRSGHTILGLRYVRLDDAGKIIERAADYKAPGHIGDKGVELEIRRDDDQSIHKLFYFSVNLSDERLRQNPQFVRFSSTLQGTTTYLKATSYMTHHPDFSIIRNIVLSRSMAVLQDDSGIPYQLYKPPWRVQLYGEYVRAYGSFKWLEQPDLRNAYLVSKPRPLPFRIGYGYGRVESNLLFATKAN